jgi:RimJ/RimL family protein N-acetyltransferase
MASVELHPEFPVVTARLTLRPLTEDDAADLLAYWSRPDVCRYVPFEPMDAAVINERLTNGQWSRRAITGEGEALSMGVELTGAGRVIGDVIVMFRSETHRGGEIGWVISPDYSGHGYATEAAHAALHLAFDQLGLHRVVARIDALNRPSIGLAGRLGMRQEAHLIGNEWFKGAWGDEVDFALLEDEWAAQHPAGPEPCAWRPAGRS